MTPLSPLAKDAIVNYATSTLYDFVKTIFVNCFMIVFVSTNCTFFESRNALVARRNSIPDTFLLQPSERRVTRVRTTSQFEGSD